MGGGALGLDPALLNVAGESSTNCAIIRLPAVEERPALAHPNLRTATPSPVLIALSTGVRGALVPNRVAMAVNGAPLQSAIKHQWEPLFSALPWKRRNHVMSTCAVG